MSILRNRHVALFNFRVKGHLAGRCAAFWRQLSTAGICISGLELKGQERPEKGSPPVNAELKWPDYWFPLERGWWWWWCWGGGGGIMSYLRHIQELEISTQGRR